MTDLTLPTPLVSVSWLRAHLRDPRVRADHLRSYTFTDARLAQVTGE